MASSTWLPHLPSALRADPILGGFLLALERVLSGRPDPETDGDPHDPLPDLEGIEEKLARVGSLFAPRPGQPDTPRTPSAFLPWLADLVSAPDREDFSDAVRRRFIQAALPAFSLRGTRLGVVETLGRFMGSADDVAVYEFEDTPYFFQVEVIVRDDDPGALGRLDRLVRALVDQVRPTHTWYSVRYLVRTMQIVDHRTAGRLGVVVGFNTLLGTRAT